MSPLAPRSGDARRTAPACTGTLPVPGGGYTTARHGPRGNFTRALAGALGGLPHTPGPGADLRSAPAPPPDGRGPCQGAPAPYAGGTLVVPRPVQAWRPRRPHSAGGRSRPGCGHGPFARHSRRGAGSGAPTATPRNPAVNRAGSAGAARVNPIRPSSQRRMELRLPRTRPTWTHAPTQWAERCPLRRCCRRTPARTRTQGSVGAQRRAKPALRPIPRTATAAAPQPAPRQGTSGRSRQHGRWEAPPALSSHGSFRRLQHRLDWSCRGAAHPAGTPLHLTARLRAEAPPLPLRLATPPPQRGGTDGPRGRAHEVPACAARFHRPPVRTGVGRSAAPHPTAGGSATRMRRVHHVPPRSAPAAYSRTAR
jgi:hypothetical protein